MTSQSGALGEIAGDASLERTSFLSTAGEQLKRFLEANRSRIKEIGGLVLIDDDPDYLSVAPDGTFRSRTRYQDDVTGEWKSETEVIESSAELVELYNPADVYAAFAEAAREAAGLEPEPTAADDLLSVAGIAQEESVSPEADVAYAGAADDWAAGQPLDADDETSAAHKLYDLALTFQERSQLAEARLIEQFQVAAGGLADQVGDMIVIDDDDERLSLSRTGQIHAEVEPEGEEGEWRKLTTPEELVEFYDPTDVFGDIADAIAEAYPAVAPELDEAEDDEEEPDEDDDDAEDDEPAADADAQPKADR